ncbi:MAG: thioredoxin [Syntrophomonadaceae bacterium]|jgi:thioredoxin 1|nr:thioredoxin [Syntrophomonadaceae bacterium]
MADVINVNDNNFEKVVVQSELPVLVDFWAPWCGPCRMVGPIVEELAQDNQGRLQVAKLNVDENRMLSDRFNVRSIPTLVFFKNGQEIKRIVGAQGKAQLQKIIDEILG